MALEQLIAEWSAGRPNWQRMILRRVAEGNPLSTDEIDKLVDELIASSPAEDVEFTLRHVPHTEPEGPQVKLVSISEPQHVNALASDRPLTFEPEGLTVVYGDNGSGKSGYARILKKIASARHQEDVLSDVFRESSLEEPTAELEVVIGGGSSSVSWPQDETPELRKMLFYDAPSGEYYIDTELDFPYRPPALYVMDGLIKTCLEIRSRVDTKLAQNAASLKALPTPDETCNDSEPARYLGTLSGDSSIEDLDRFIAGCNPARIEDLKNREVQLRSTDTAKEQRRLLRDAE